MKVKSLIDMLSKVDPESEVVIQDREDWYYDLGDIEESVPVVEGRRIYDEDDDEKEIKPENFCTVITCF